MRSTRLTLCRRFGPSPCPTHYDGRWATTPSADCCAITPRRYHRVRCRMVVGSGGCSTAFAVARSPAPVTLNCDLRVRWLLQAFRHGPQFDSHSHTGRMLHSSPRIRTCAFSAQPPHLPYPLEPWASSCCANSPAEPSLLCDFCPSARTFALGLPSDTPSRACPCPRLVVILMTSGPPTGDFHPISSCPCRAYTISCTGLASSVASLCCLRAGELERWASC